jgi:nicotinamidase-related amidase
MTKGRNCRLALGQAALATIDVQNDTLEGQPLELPGAAAAIPNIAMLCRAFRAAGTPIVHVVRLYLADSSNAEVCRRDLVWGSTPMLRPGTRGRSLAAELLEPGTADLDDNLLLGPHLHLHLFPRQADDSRTWGSDRSAPGSL